MNLLEWLETSEHRHECTAWSEGQWCCFDYIPDDIAEKIEVINLPEVEVEGRWPKPQIELKWKP